MSDLWARLQNVSSAPRSVKLEPIDPPVGWTLTAPFVMHRCQTETLDESFWNLLGPQTDIRADRVFLDTETTGLSGGAGVVAFLVGWSRWEPGERTPPQVRIDQWVLLDFAGERDLVDQLDTELHRVSELVTFNGASYDLPLLRNRWILQGREFPTIPHRDALHPARRLWKPVVDSCRLSRLETLVLGIQREDDLPGAEVPERWLRAVRERSYDLVEAIAAHHAQDVFSLGCLDTLIRSIVREPQSSQWRAAHTPLVETTPIFTSGILQPSLGTSVPVGFWGLLALQETGEAEDRLEESWEAQADPSIGWEWSLRLKSRGDPRAPEIWRILWDRHRSYTALLELAKWLEHRTKTLSAWDEALNLLKEGLSAPFLPRKWKDDLDRRLLRISAKRTALSFSEEPQTSDGEADSSPR